MFCELVSAFTTTDALRDTWTFAHRDFIDMQVMPVELNRATPTVLEASSKVYPPDRDCKTTVLKGYFATGDMEYFCFDKCPGPYAYREQLQVDPRYAAWVNGEDHCRVYPNDLLPEGIEHKQGTWSITITFTPDEEDEEDDV